MNERGKRPKPVSRAAAAVHETARGLHRIGLINEREMAHFDALCLQDREPFPPARIKKLRRKLNVGQEELATFLNTSVSTVQKWEIGARKPSGPSLKLLNLLERKGIQAVA